MRPLLELKKLNIHFGGLKAVVDLDLQISPQAIFGLIGPNGAGKTTVFNLITGVYAPSGGEIFFQQKNIGAQKPNQICKHGIARTFQNIRLFKQLTVLENLLVAMDSSSLYHHLNLFPTLLQSDSAKQLESQKRKQALVLLDAFHLQNYKDEFACNLPYGDQRRLEIARAMATGCKLLLLDEPAAGMNLRETEKLMQTIHHIRKEWGLTIFLIEHDMKLVMGICEQIAVLDYGVKIAEGSPEEIKKNSKVIEAYLGRSQK